MAKGLFFEEGLFVLLLSDVLLHDILFTPFAFLMFFHQPQGMSTPLGAGQHTRLSTFPEPSCWLSCTEGGPGGSRMCHRGFGSGPCPRSRSVSVRVEELASLSVLRFELVIIKIVDQVL